MRRINLVPADQRRRTGTNVGMLVLLLVAVILFGGTAFIYLQFSSERDQRRTDLAAVAAQRAQVESQLTKYGEFQSLEAQRKAVETLVQQIYSSRTFVSEILGDLSLVVPPNVWFETMSLAAPDAVAAATGAAAPAASATASPPLGVLSIQGKTYEFEDVARLLVRLKQIPALTGVTLQDASVTDSPDGSNRKLRQFNIRASVKNTQAAGAALPITQVEVAPK